MRVGPPHKVPPSWKRISFFCVVSQFLQCMNPFNYQLPFIQIVSILGTPLQPSVVQLKLIKHETLDSTYASFSAVGKAARPDARTWFAQTAMRRIHQKWLALVCLSAACPNYLQCLWAMFESFGMGKVKSKCEAMFPQKQAPRWPTKKADQSRCFWIRCDLGIHDLGTIEIDAPRPKHLNMLFGDTRHVLPAMSFQMLVTRLSEDLHATDHGQSKSRLSLQASPALVGVRACIQPGWFWEHVLLAWRFPLVFETLQGRFFSVLALALQLCSWSFVALPYVRGSCQARLCLKRASHTKLKLKKQSPLSPPIFNCAFRLTRWRGSNPTPHFLMASEDRKA